MEERIEMIQLNKLQPFPSNPYQVRDDDSMRELTESIKNFGVLQPIVVRQMDDGNYQIIAGHRRKHACELAKRQKVPCIVRDLDDDSAIVFMVDSNFQRENVLPSERAKAYKMKLDALKRQGARTDLTSSQFETKFHRADERVAESSGESRAQIQRYIRLMELQPELQQMVDDGKIGLTPAVEISYLKPEEQTMLLETIDSEQATPSLSQAQRMKKLSREGQLDDDSMLGIMMEQKKPEKFDITLSGDKLRKYFPQSYTPKKIQDTIFGLLDAWLRKRQRDRSI